jgi:hypothetical protein
MKPPSFFSKEGADVATIARYIGYCRYIFERLAAWQAEDGTLADVEKHLSEPAQFC